MKSKPERTCAVCRRKASKNEFIRVVKNKDGSVLIDYTMRADGRGAYICKNSECIQNAKKRNAFERSFKTKIEPSVYSQIENVLSGD